MARMGRPPFEASDKQRASVKALVGMGATEADIASLIGISEPTLRKHFKAELRVGGAEANAKVAQSLFRQATDTAKPNVAAAIFWMKARAGWSETDAKAEEGKKQQRAKRAETVSKGRFAAIKPPKLVVNNSR